jgi:hypothetical protein
MHPATWVLARTEGKYEGRRLFVVDIENIVGGACLLAENVSRAKHSLLEAVEPLPGDHIVVGVSHIGLIHVGCSWPDLRYVVQSGPDGADLKLLEVLNENIPSRFGEVVLASGDGIFAEAVSALGAHGVTVTVVAGREKLSRRLELAAARVVFLDSIRRDHGPALLQAVA